MALPSIYVPTRQVPFVLQGLFSNEKFAQLLAADILSSDILGEAVNAGDFINIPQAVQIPDLSRVDLTSTTAASGTRVSTNDSKCPVVRDYSMPIFTKADVLRTGEDFESLNARTAGNKMAKSIIQNLDATLKGVIGTVTSHSVNATAGAAGAMVVQDIRKAKRLLGDQYDRATVMLIHPDVFTDLIADLTGTYKYSGNLSGQWLVDGLVQNVMGINKIIVSSDLSAAAGATSSQGDDSYYTWIFAPQEDGIGAPVHFGYQAQPRVEQFVDVRVPDTLTYQKFSLDYAVGVRGMKWNASTPNPTLANLADNTKWDAAYEDHRNVGVVCVRSGGLKA